MIIMAIYWFVKVFLSAILQRSKFDKKNKGDKYIEDTCLREDKTFKKKLAFKEQLDFTNTKMQLKMLKKMRRLKDSCFCTTNNLLIHRV